MDTTILQDAGVILQLVILEGLLSLDNALALAALVESRLKDPLERKRALTWGIWGAYLLRTIIIFVGTWIMQNPWAKAVAGGYLVWMAVNELFLKRKGGDEEHAPKAPVLSFLKLSPLWSTIVAVEIMDVMFSIDSIGVALVLSKKKWVLILGAILGILMMRLAAQVFIHLIDRFPVLTKTAFILVGIAGINIILELNGLPIPFTGGYRLVIDKAIPEGPFLALLFTIFFGSMLMNWLFPKWFAAKH